MQRRFKAILADLQKHAELVEKEAWTLDVAEAQKSRRSLQEWRDQHAQQIAKEEKQHAISQYQAVLSWLECKDSEQHDIFDAISSSCYPETCDWAIKNTKFVNWLRNGEEQRFLWLVGKPGSGKQQSS